MTHQNIEVPDSSADGSSRLPPWRPGRFDSLAVLQRGFDLPSTSRKRGDVPIIGSNGIVGWHDVSRVRGPGVVTGRSGSIGESSFIGTDFWPLNTALFVSNFNGNDPRYVQYFLEWFDLSRFKSGVSVPTLNRNMVHDSDVAIPPLIEQQKIAAILWNAQRAIANQDQLIANTRDLKRAAMDMLLTRGLHGGPLQQTEMGAMPAAWSLSTIGHVATLGSGGTPSRTEPSYWLGGTIPWVKTGEVDYCVITSIEEKITEAGLAASAAKLYPKGTLLMAMYGQGVTRGKVAILGIEAATNQACAAITLKSKDVRSDFLYYVLTHGYERLRGLAHGGNQQNLNADLIRGFIFGLPPTTEEQRDIATALATIDRKLAHHQRKRAALNDLFQTLLHKLMTAEIRVNDLDIDTSKVAATAA